MRIGIDLRVLGTGKGVERYSTNIVSEILKIDKKNKYVLLTDDPVKVTKWDNPYFLLPAKRVMTDHLRFGRLIKGCALDLVFHPDNTEFLNCQPNSVVTLHDVMPWKFPELILSQNPLLKARQMLYFKLQETALRKASHVITVSQNSKKDIIKILGISDEKITVIYEGIEEVFAQKTDKNTLSEFKISGDYIFYIGGFSPYKNVLSLLKAYALLVGRGLKLKLVLAGKTEETKGGQSAFHNIMTEIIKNNIQDKVVFTDYVSDERLPTLYQNASVFVFPSLYEGFGFPPLEAMKAGVPVVSSNRASLGEILEGGAMLLDPTNPEILANAIEVVLNNKAERNKLVIKAKKLVDRLTWSRAAESTIDLFNHTAASATID